MDVLLGTDPHFLLGNWLEAAKAIGTTDDEKKLYEYNARNQITLWGPTGQVTDSVCSSLDFKKQNITFFLLCLNYNVKIVQVKTVQEP